MRNERRCCVRDAPDSKWAFRAIPHSEIYAAHSSNQPLRRPSRTAAYVTGQSAKASEPQVYETKRKQLSATERAFAVGAATFGASLAELHDHFNGAITKAGLSLLPKRTRERRQKQRT